MELLFFKHDHAAADPTLPIEQIAALHKPFDLVTAQLDGWAWGKEELTHPWFRIVSLPAALATMDDAETFLAPLLPVPDKNGQLETLWQRRSHYLKLDDTTVIPQSFIDWWADDTRAVPIFDASETFAGTAATLGVARPTIANPAYVGSPQIAKAITS